MTKKITVYSKPDCYQCEMSKRYLAENGVQYEVINVFQDDEALKMLQDEGYAQMPVVEIDGVKHTGFKPEILAKLVVK